MFLLAIINSLFFYVTFSFVELEPWIKIPLSSLPFIYCIDLFVTIIFIKIPTFVSSKYVNLKVDKSLVFNIEKYTNKTIARAIIAIIFSLRSFEVKDVFTKSTLIIVMILISYDYDNSSLIPPILQSIIAALIFDFIIIRIPNELKKQDSINLIKSNLSLLTNAHLALRGLTIEPALNKEGLSEKNIERSFNSIVSKNFGDAISSRLHVSNSLKYMKQRKVAQSINDEIIIILREIFECVDILMKSDEINQFPELKLYLINIGKNGIYSEFIKNKVHDYKQFHCLELNGDWVAKSFIDGYMIPLDGVCYWYKRKARRYIGNDYRPFINFDYYSTKLFHTYSDTRVYTSSIKEKINITKV